MISYWNLNIVLLNGPLYIFLKGLANYKYQNDIVY